MIGFHAKTRSRGERSPRLRFSPGRARSRPQGNAAEQYALQPVVTDARGAGTSTSRLAMGMERLIGCEVVVMSEGNEATGEIQVPRG